MRILYWITIIGIVFAFVSAYLIKIDVSSSSRGMIRSEHENVALNAVISGKIQYINLKNNKKVIKGDTLLIVESISVDSQKDLREELVEEHGEHLNDLRRLIKGTASTSNLKSSLYQSDFYNFIARKREFELVIKQEQRTYNRFKSLFDEGVISANEFEQYENRLDKSLFELKSFISQKNNEWQNALHGTHDEIEQYHSEIQQLEEEKRKFTLIAPISGEIVSYQGLQKGSFLNASTSVAQIAPGNDLVVECFVSPNDIGLIQEKQQVNLQIDAYNYNQWGLAKAQVTDIDKNITLENNQSYFKVRCRLLQNHLSLASGYKGELKKGMTLTARFILQKRTLWEILYDDLDDWLNPKNLDANTLT